MLPEGSLEASLPMRSGLYLNCVEPNQFCGCKKFPAVSDENFCFVLSVQDVRSKSCERAIAFIAMTAGR